MNQPTLSDEEIKRVTKRAADLVGDMPDTLKGQAFSKVFDTLIGQALGVSAPSGGSDRAAPPARPKRGRAQTGGPNPGRIANLLSRIDRTKYPNISSGRTARDLALRVLQLSEADHQTEWLTPGEISMVLREKFRVSVSTAAIRMAISDRTTLVDRRKSDGTFEYRLMQGGEGYLAGPRGNEGPRKISRRASKRKAPPKSPQEGDAKIGSESGSVPLRRGGAGRSPTVLLSEILKEGYFDSARTISEVVGHLSHKKAHKLKSTDLSPVLTRMLRKGDLNREKNGEGQYAYTRR